MNSHGKHYQPTKAQLRIVMMMFLWVFLTHSLTKFIINSTNYRVIFFIWSLFSLLILARSILYVKEKIKRKYYSRGALIAFLMIPFSLLSAGYFIGLFSKEYTYQGTCSVYGTLTKHPFSIRESYRYLVRTPSDLTFFVNMAQARQIKGAPVSLRDPYSDPCRANAEIIYVRSFPNKYFVVGVR